MVPTKEESEQTPVLANKEARLETDLSWIYLTDSHAYKVKKPLKINGRDYSTLALREKACQREARLNARFATAAKLDVLPLFGEPEHWSFSGVGEPTEFCIRMPRLPADHMLDQLLGERPLEADELKRLADALASFYQSAKTSEKISRAGAPSAIEANLRANLKALEDLEPPILVVDCIESAQLEFIAVHQDLLEKRVQNGKIRDGHGELIAAHLCMTPQPVALGCAEYSDRARQKDILEDLALLLVDLELMGHKPLADSLWIELAQRLGEKVDEPLLDFYKSMAACSHARHEALFPAGIERARKLAEIARVYCKKFHRARVFVTVGLLGAGKSTLSQALAQTLGMKRISAQDVYSRKFASQDKKARPIRLCAVKIDQLYDEMCSEAKDFLLDEISVIMDADFHTRPHRAKVSSMAAELGVPCLFLECRISKNEIIARLDRRRKKDRTMARIQPELYDDHKERYEPLDELTPQVVLSLNTSQPVPSLVDSVIETLKKATPPGE
ncbi:MAG: AAA family ATPase [Planctomycetota bacterium]